jgi:hypothetical protein
MDPREFLNNAIDFLMDRFGQPVVSPSRQPPDPSMGGIPFGPYQPLINRAEDVKNKLNEQTRRKEEFIRKELGGY